MSLHSFDFESHLNLTRGNIVAKRSQLEAQGLNLELWDSFRFQVLISFIPKNRFEALLSLLSATILTEELNAICSDPQTGEILEKKQVSSWAIERVKQCDLDMRCQNTVTHPFDGWK
ncbi:hypothetical protein [uncultured Tateyamaria sp.]|uniref:hypothetical protein n=1 Tax=uncultured Tateyamaria sp. TaxID=455651 RepID=UPI00261AA949|nr:hypothetical protein [uncultured Tateyamaria sp.]